MPLLFGGGGDCAANWPLIEVLSKHDQAHVGNICVGRNLDLEYQGASTDLLQLKEGGRIPLSLCVLRRGKSIGPPTVFPIVDVLVEDDDVGGRYRLFTFEPPEEQVRGRTAGAAFGSK